MEEKKKHKVMIGIEVVLLCMIIAILGTNAASGNPPSNGVSYSKNSQTTVEGALNDLYNKANYGNASASQVLSGKTALVGGKKITGTMPNYSSSIASAIVPWNGSIYFRMPAGYYNAGQTWGSEVSATNADVASAIGLTAGKLIKGQTVLGITGTGETGYSSCSSCCASLASQTSSATAGAGDILSGKTAYVNGSKITGTMTNRGAVTETVSPGGSYTIPAGYHNGSGKVTASSCPICSMTETSTSSELTYTDGMTLSAKGTYVFCVTAAKYDSKAYATITYTYGSDAAVNTVWEYAARMEVSNNTTNTKCRVVYVKSDTTFTRRVTGNNGVVKTSIFKVS